ncbi:MAG: hypothetical protein ABJC26_11700 [Gemmatimonadaceae bacterium]
MQLDSKEQIATGWAGIGSAGNVPQRASTGKSNVANPKTEAASDAPAKRGWARGAFNFARNAAIGLLMFTLIPVALVSWRHAHPAKYDPSYVQERLVDVERMRPLMAAKDASITPMQAGTAFRALQLASSNDEFPANTVAQKAARPWKSYKLTPDMFVMRTSSFNGPSPKIAVEMAARGYSSAEMAYLRSLAESPVWRDFDLVGAANGVDIIGGIYVRPFKANASALDMPMTRFADTKELAIAGVSRAAYYLASGDKIRAEAALRSVVSFGFAMIDNGTSDMDGLLGRVIVEIGRDGMEQFNLTTNSIYAATEVVNYKAFKPSSATRVAALNKASVMPTADVYRQRLIENAANPALPRSLRFETLRQLSLSSCDNVPEMLFGPKADIRAAFDNAEKTLARYPSEKAYLELLYASTSRAPQGELPPWAIERFFDGAVTIAATVTQNPRLAACSRVALMYRQ